MIRFHWISNGEIDWEIRSVCFHIWCDGQLTIEFLFDFLFSVSFCCCWFFVNTYMPFNNFLICVSVAPKQQPPESSDSFLFLIGPYQIGTDWFIWASFVFVIDNRLMTSADISLNQFTKFPVECAGRYSNAYIMRPYVRPKSIVSTLNEIKNHLCLNNACARFSCGGLRICAI